MTLPPAAVRRLHEGDDGTTHGEPYAYDAQVPVVLYGQGVKPGLYRMQVHASDVAPTTAIADGDGRAGLGRGRAARGVIVQGR